MFLVALALIAAQKDVTPFLRAYPDPMPSDISFNTVVKSQPFPALRFSVPIIGWKEHPEEVHVCPNGGLVFPRGGGGLHVVPMLGDPPQLLPLEGGARKLVDGYKPGVETTWKVGQTEVMQLGFCSLLGATEVKTGRETLLANSRYTIRNLARTRQRVSFWLNFGEARGGRSMMLPPLASAYSFAYRNGLVTDRDGKTVARVLAPGASVSFRPLRLPQETDRTCYVALNPNESTIRPVFEIPLERDGETISTTGWKSTHGFELYFEASIAHTVPCAAQVEVRSADGRVASVGTLYRSGLWRIEQPLGDYLAPGQHTAGAPWSALSPYIPRGKSTLILRGGWSSRGMAFGPVGTWESIFYLAEPGHVPNFKWRGDPDPKENSLRFVLDLAPGQSKSLDLSIPYFPASSGLGTVSVDKELTKFRQFWEKELNRNAEFIVPEPRIRNAYRAALAYNLILTDHNPETGLLEMHPDATMYESVWAGDGSVSLQAMDRMGYHREADRWSRYFLKNQGSRKPDGDVAESRGFLHGDALAWMNEDGFVLWALSEHYKLTRDAAWLRGVAPAMLQGCDWIVRQRARTKDKPSPHYGLLPAGRPSDLYVWDDWYWSDTYSYTGLRGTADVLAAIGMTDDGKRLSAEADDYKKCILESLERAMNKEVSPPFVPPSPTRNQAPSAERFNEWWYSICSPIYMVEAGLLPARDGRTEWLEYWLEKYGLYTGLCAFGNGSIDPHYVYNEALAELLRGETGKFLWTFYSLFAYAQSRDTFAPIEGMNLLTGFNGDAWDANRQPHMHSNSRALDMVRIALVLEDGSTLHLLAGTPTGWLADGKGIEVRRAPTYFGEVNLEAVSRGRTITYTIHPVKAANVVLHVRPPASYGLMKSVTVNGKRWQALKGETVILGSVARKTVVVCRF